MLRRAILGAYPDRVARRVGSGEVQLVGGRRARLAPECTVRDAPLLVVPRLRGGRRGAPRLVERLPALRLSASAFWERVSTAVH